MNHRALSLLTTVAVTGSLLAAGGVSANEPEYRGSSASSSQQMDCPTRANRFEPFSLAWLVDGLDVEDGERSIRCVTEVRNGGKGQKRVKVTLEGEIVDLNGNMIQTLGTKSERTNRPPGYNVIEFPVGPLVPEDYGVVIEGRTGSRKFIETHTTTCTSRNRKPCVPGNTALCLLNDNRFKVEVDWRDFDGSTGPGRVKSSSFDSGIFYFFNPNDQDLLVKLIEACSDNDNFWVWANASTNVEFNLTVTDTETGEIREYGSPLGQVFQPITDTSAFATCP